MKRNSLPDNTKHITPISYKGIVAGYCYAIVENNLADHDHARLIKCYRRNRISITKLVSPELNLNLYSSLVWKSIPKND